jgi:hypothetical protein
MGQKSKVIFVPHSLFNDFSQLTKNLGQNVVHSDPDLVLHNSSVLIDKEPFFTTHLLINKESKKAE